MLNECTYTKIKCLNCNKFYYQENGFTITCPHCDNSLDNITSTGDKIKFNNLIISLYGVEYFNRWVLSDLREKLRSRCYSAFKAIKENKPYNTEKILGAPFNIVKKHIEQQFTKDMSWKNMGRKGWHIDHIIPLALASNKDELVKLLHYKNIRPMWENDNRLKSSWYKNTKITYKNRHMFKDDIINLNINL